MFTTLPLDEIERLAALQGGEINEAKKVLATEATRLVHGRAAAEEPAATARTTFEEGGLGASLPTVPIPAGDFGRECGVIDAAVLAGLVASNGEARRLIRGGGLKSQRQNDITMRRHLLDSVRRNASDVIKLSLGRKRHVLLKPV